MKILILSVLLLLLNQSIFSQKTSERVTIHKHGESRIPVLKSAHLNGLDGPYIINDTLYSVNSENQLILESQFNRDSLLVSVDNLDLDQFYVCLQPTPEIFKSTYSIPKKMVVISDIEGNYDAFASFLMSNKIIDGNHNWIYGEGHLVLLGDFVDRGKNVTQILWLIYKLEHQARVTNGHVHFILGNHEVLNFQGDSRYNRPKYVKLAQVLSGEIDRTNATKFLYSDKSILAQWLATKNVVEKIGKYLFTHAGLSPDILEYQLAIDEINTKVRQAYYQDERDRDNVTTFLYSSKGPFWYRGLVKSHRSYDKINSKDLDDILSFYKAEKVVIGHTPVTNISSGFNEKVLMLDVHHGYQKNSGRTKGLLIVDGIEYIISALGVKTLLEL